MFWKKYEWSYITKYIRTKISKCINEKVQDFYTLHVSKCSTVGADHSHSYDFCCSMYTKKNVDNASLLTFHHSYLYCFFNFRYFFNTHDFFHSIYIWAFQRTSQICCRHHVTWQWTIGLFQFALAVRFLSRVIC